MAALARQVTPQLVDDPTSKTAPIRTALRQERMRSCLRRRSEALSPQADMVLASHVRRESGRLCPTLSKQYLTLCCRATGESDVVMATLCPVTTTGYIARRIVRRLRLDPRTIPTAPESVTWGRTDLFTTKQFVDLACTGVLGPDQDVYRFYVVKGCPFDILLGPRMNTL